MTKEEYEKLLEIYDCPLRSWGYVRGKERIEHLNTLIQIAENTNNPRAWGYVHYVKSGICYDNGNFPEGYEEARKAMTAGSACNNWWIKAMAFNNLGVFYIQEENIITAFDYYWQGIHCIAEAEEDDPALLFLLYGNIAECMLFVKEYEKSLQYYSLIKGFKIPDDFVHIPMNTVFCNISMMECYYMLGRYEEAWDLILEVERLEREHEETAILHFSLLIWKYVISLTIGKSCDIKSMENELLNFHYECNTLITLKVLCTFLYERREFAFFNKALSFLEKEAKEQNNLSLQIFAADLWLQYFEETGQVLQFQNKCALFYKLQRKREDQDMAARSSILNTMIGVSERVEQQRTLERSNKILKIKSEYDELTGLPNRYRMNDFSKAAFENAIENHNTIAVEILDVDCFKQINDHYGHLFGDQCLKAVANVIKTTLASGDLGARYGGDEFIIIRPGRTDEELKLLMEGLRKSVLDLGILNQHSTVAPVMTITQGAINRIPGKGDTIINYLKLADQTLYQAKKKGKNTYELYQAVPIGESNDNKTQ